MSIELGVVFWAEFEINWAADNMAGRGRKQIFGDETSTSDSSEESSSEEEQQQGAESGQGQSSSSSESGDESGSGSEKGEEPEEGQQDPAPSASTFPNTQDLFGGDSSSESSSESEADGEATKMDTGSPAGSGTPEPPEMSPLGGSPLEGSPVRGSPSADDESGEGDSAQKQTVEGIFGDAADLSSSDDDMPTASSLRREREEVAEFGGDLDEDAPPLGLGEEGEGEVEEEEAPRINVDIPRCVAQLGTEVSFVKLPNFLSVETRPFDPELYEDEGDDDDVLDEEGRARLKLKVENTIRWRYTQDEDGNEVRESNARVVRWTDGTMSLYLGSEIFDISRQPLQGEFSHLFVRQGTGLQGQAVFKNKLTFRPHSTDSQTHRKMTLSIADRFSKAQKIRVLPVAGKDPETQRSERIRKEEQNLRAAIRQDQQKRRVRESHPQKHGLTASYLEPDRFIDADEDITAIKSSVKSRLGRGAGGGRGGQSYESEESSEAEEEAHERLMRAKVSTRAESPTSPERGGGGKRQTRASARGGGRRVAKSRKLVSSSEEESD